MAQRLGCPEFDAALQQFLKGADEIDWKTRKGGGAGAEAIVYDGAGEWVFHAPVLFHGEEYSVPHRLRLSSDGVNAAFLAEGHPLGEGCTLKGKGTWEAADNGTAIKLALTMEVHVRSTAAGAPQPGVSVATPVAVPVASAVPVAVPVAAAAEPEPEAELEPPSDAHPASPKARTGGGPSAEAAQLVSTQECTMLLRKDYREASGLSSLLGMASNPTNWRLAQARKQLCRCL